MRRLVLAACIAALVHASPAPVAKPAVTPAALLPRTDQMTLGWYSGATIGDQTIYSAWAYDADATTYTSSSTWFRRCAVGSTCVMYTGCSGGYMVAESTSTFCGAGGGATSSFCSNHVLYTSLGASQAHSWYWCDTPPLTGYTFYEKQPAQPTGLSVSSAPVSSSASTTGSSSASSTTASGSSIASSTAPPAQSSTAASSGSSTNVGAIAGGVVGGIAGLALIGAGAFFLLYRKKRENNAAGPPPAAGYAPPIQQQGTYQQPGYPASPNMQYATAYQSNEAKPQGVETGGYYGPQQPAPYPQGPYDPHMSQYGSAPVEAGPGVASPTGPAPQELSTQK